MQSHRPSLLLAGLGLLWLLGFVLFRAWREEEAPGAAALQLSAEVLGGGAEITGTVFRDEHRSTMWDLWLELYLVPVAGIPATISLHRITGALEIVGLHGEGFEALVLETAYQIPPNVLRILGTGRDRPQHITVTTPMGVLLVAYCQTPA